MRPFLFTLLVVSSIPNFQAQESAQYLRNAIRDLRYMKGVRQSLKRVDTIETPSTPPPAHSTEAEDRNGRVQNVPPLTLTKGELAALYEAAVAKGETVKINSGGNSYIQAAVHELDDTHDSFTDQHEAATAGSGDSGDTSGYYYYYYPIKSFLDEISSQPSSPEKHYHSSPSSYHEVVHTTVKPHYQYHSHTHQHNVKITSTKDVATTKKDSKGLEPLFMAISGFIGMAVMFVLSVLVFPKFGILKSRASPKGNNAKKNERITDIARVALRAIEGKDCAERFACELEKTARAFNLQDNRFVKLLKRMAPGSFTRHIGKFNTKRLKCTAIPCKKNPPKKKNNAGASNKKS